MTDEPPNLEARLSLLESRLRSLESRHQCGPLPLESRITMRTEEVAAVLGVSPRKARQMIVEEGIPHFYSGTVPLVPVDGLRAWANERPSTESKAETASSARVLQRVRRQR